MTQGRVTELDGLRGIAALCVLLFHFSPYTGPLTFIRPVADLGWVGLDLFFVLSGYLITGILLQTVGQPRYYRDFMIRRALRIFPLYYACLAVFIVALYLAPDQSAWNSLLQWGSPGWFIAYAGNIRAAIVNDYPPVDALIPLWSLHVEEQFYVLAPLLVAVCRPATLRRILIGAVIGAPACRIALTVLAPDHVLATWWLPTSRMDGLALGALLALSARRGTVPFSPAAFARLSVACGAACALLFAVRSSAEIEDSFVRSIGFTLVSLMFVCLLAAVLGAPGSRATALLRWQPLVYLSRISYGLYLMHLPASLMVRTLARPFVTIEPHDSLNLPLSLALSLVLATLSWRFFESPLLLLKDRMTELKPSAAFALEAPRAAERTMAV